MTGICYTLVFHQREVMNKTIKRTLKRFVPPFVIAFIQEMRIKNQIKDLLSQGKDIYLEIGAGDRKGEKGWITLDKIKNCDICWDLRKGIPFPDESVQKIYSSHLFEHLSFKDGQKLLDECLRVLVPSGSFSICVPNAKIYIDAYITRKELDSIEFFGCESY
jgi:SAM-dependent methyltransferase